MAKIEPKRSGIRRKVQFEVTNIIEYTYIYKKILEPKSNNVTFLDSPTENIRNSRTGGFN